MPSRHLSVIISVTMFPALTPGLPTSNRHRRPHRRLRTNVHGSSADGSRSGDGRRPAVRRDKARRVLTRAFAATGG